MIFEYNEQGEIAKITDYGDFGNEDSYKYEYEFTFTDEAVIVRGNSWTYDDYLHERPLNKQRYVARCTTGVHTYDADGHLLTTADDTLTWQAGNLVAVRGEWNISKGEFKYTDIENKANIDFAVALYYDYYCSDYYDDYLDALGYYGKTNRNLLASSRYCVYSYKYDNEGYVIQFTEKPTDNNYDFNEATTYKVEYCD